MNTMTINGNEVTIPEWMTVTVTPEGSMTFSPVLDSPSRKEFVRSPNSKTGYAGNIDRFAEAVGVSLEGWTLTDILDSLREWGQVGDLEYHPGEDEFLVGMPEGWAFGPSAMNYLTSGEWLTK